MTGITDVRSIDMVRTFTTSLYTIMTSVAVVDKWRVINRRWYPLLGTMAKITLLCRGDMIYSFTLRNNIIMTT